MSTTLQSKPMLVSQKTYERLLAAYPKVHREQYGPAMAQLFRDQSRDAWREARSWGLMMLWLRVLPDLVKTSVLEHLSSLKGRKSMFEKISEVLRPRSAPFRVFFGVFLAVFLLVFGGAATISFMLPDTYLSTTRIKLQTDAEIFASQSGAANSTAYDPHFLQTQFEVIKSEGVLGKVVGALDLTTKWGKKYRGERLKTSEAIELLRRLSELRPIRNTGLVEIRVFSENPHEAATIANAIAESYKTFTIEVASEKIEVERPQSSSVTIVDPAVPGLRPVRPNKPLNLVLGGLTGGALALGLGSVAAVITFIARKKLRRQNVVQ